MKLFSKLTVLVLFGLLVLAGCATGPGQAEDAAKTVTEASAEKAETAGEKDAGEKAEPLSLKIIHTNDHHSHLDGSAFDLMLNGEETRVDLGGFSRLVSVIEEERTDNSILLNSGELNGTLYFSVFKGEPDFKVFNEIGVDAYALGNHEFDEGDGRLAELIELADFPIVSSNAAPNSDSPLYRVRDQIKPYVIKEINGQKVGIIGILKVEKTKNSSLVSDDVEFSPEIETAKKYVDELEGKGINKIVLLSHVGYYNDVLFAKHVPGIDVIVGGDSHSLLDSTGALEDIGLGVDYHGQTGPFPGYSHEGVESEDLGEYPTTVKGPTGEPVHIVTAWQYAYGVGVLDVQFDEEGIARKAGGNIILPVEGPFLRENDEGERVEVDAAAREQIMETISASPVLTYAEQSKEMESLLDPYREEIEAMKNEPIGTIAETMGFNRIPKPFGRGETPTGSYAAYVVSEAFRQTNPGIDVAIQNAGGVRTELLEGPFTVGDAIKALPFSNTVVMLDMTGREIVDVLNQAAYYSLHTGSTGAFPYAAGLRYDVYLNADEGEVIRNVEVKDRETGSWSQIDMDTVYTVSTNSFTALGKDNYLEFKKVRDEDPTAFEDTYITYYVPLKEYVEDQPNDTLQPIDPAQYCLKSVNE